MDWKLVFWLLSFTVFWGYAAWYIFRWGIPKSWSDTFYNLGEYYNNRNKGYIFTGVLWSMAFPLIPIVLDNEHNLMFLVLAAIMFIGAAPTFKDTKLEKLVHMTGAYTSVIAGIATFGLSYDLWYTSIVMSLLVIGLYFKWKPKNKTMWVESLVIFTGQIIVLIKDVLTI